MAGLPAGGAVASSGLPGASRHRDARGGGRRIRPRRRGGVPGCGGGRAARLPRPRPARSRLEPRRGGAAHRGGARYPRSPSPSARNATSPGSATSMSTSCASFAASARRDRPARSSSRRSSTWRAASSARTAIASAARRQVSTVGAPASGSTHAAASRAAGAAPASSTAGSAATNSSCATPGGARAASAERRARDRSDPEIGARSAVSLPRCPS